MSPSTMSPSTTPLLLQPVKIGRLQLAHRVVLAPLTRLRSSKTSHVPANPLVKEYYSQRGSVPGTLLITEATFIASKAGGYSNIPGIWSEEQIKAWKEVTDQVHRNGSYIYLQLWALGRTADPAVLASEDPSHVLVGASPIPVSGRPAPKELTIEEIREFVRLYAQAAKNAVRKAGFDGAEIHGANGYLIDQFLQDVSNQRTDEYGGSIEKRSKFGLEVVKAVSDAIGEDRTAIRLSPWSPFLSMRMEDPIPQFSYFVSELKEKHPNLAYLHIVEPRISGDNDAHAHQIEEVDSNDFIRKIWKPLPLIVAGGYTPETGIKAAEENGELVAFGRRFISNPDLPIRIRDNIPLTPYERKTFYAPGDSPEAYIGYTDYPFAHTMKL